MLLATELAELAAWENEVLRAVHSLTGSMEGKLQTLEDGPLARQYQAIHMAYTKLASHSSEALKRALFIQWYWTAEPSIYSGILLLDDTAVNQVLLLLEQQLIADEADPEWCWMLPWYYSIMEVIFEQVAHQPRFQQWLTTYSADNWQADPILQPFEQRGQMGRYWLSILGSIA